MNLISIVTPCFNEKENVQELYDRVKHVMSDYAYDYEHIFIDNASSDNTVEILRGLAAQDGRVKVIINTRNFGHVRSPRFTAVWQKAPCSRRRSGCRRARPAWACRRRTSAPRARWPRTVRRSHAARPTGPFARHARHRR